MLANPMTTNQKTTDSPNPTLRTPITRSCRLPSRTELSTNGIDDAAESGRSHVISRPYIPDSINFDVGDDAILDGDMRSRKHFGHVVMFSGAFEALFAKPTENTAY
jgi:hypothetical protein